MIGEVHSRCKYIAEALLYTYNLWSFFLTVNMGYKHHSLVDSPT